MGAAAGGVGAGVDGETDCEGVDDWAGVDDCDFVLCLLVVWVAVPVPPVLEPELELVWRPGAACAARPKNAPVRAAPTAVASSVSRRRRASALSRAATARKRWAGRMSTVQQQAMSLG